MREQLITAEVNGDPVGVRQSHRGCRGSHEGYEGTLVTVTASVYLSADDVAAVLFYWASEGLPGELFDDDGVVREMVAEAVINCGCGQIDGVRSRVSEAVNSSFWAYCQQRATAVFGHGVEQRGLNAQVAVA